MTRTAAAALCLLLLATASSAQLVGLPNGRSHPELRWTERESEHFVAIYHQGLEDVAVKALTIAEQVYGPITRALNTPMPGKTSILLSAEDEIVNGFALTGRMFVWVNVNDYVTGFGGADKWLRQVIAHEFQHNVWIQAQRDWMGVVSLVRTPAWFVEGLAEYQTEEWGAGRSDLAVRNAFLQNQHRKLDPHDSGFTKVRYLAQAYGDSVIVRAVKKRNWLGLADFPGGFEEATGVTLAQFEEEWRRVATAHTYALLSQKEEVTEVGEAVKAPARRVAALTHSPDGRHMAVLAQFAPAEAPVLMVVATDSTQTTTVVDTGRIDGDVGFSPDGQRLVYAKFHRGDHGSLVWDLKVADWSARKARWITHGRRASHPHWSPVEDRIVFTAIDGSTTNLYTCDAQGNDVRALTEHEDDVQVLGPRFCPDGARVVFSKFEEGRGLDLAILDLATGDTRYVTQGKAHDTQARWSPGGERVFFQSDRNRDEVPNVHTVPADGDESQVEVVTDVGEALFLLDVHPLHGDIYARGLNSTDSLRLRKIDPARRVEVVDPVIRPRFVSWRDRVPPDEIAPIDYAAVPPLGEPRTYRPWRHFGFREKLVLPSLYPWGVSILAMGVDSAHRHAVLVGADVGTTDDGFGPRGGYVSWDTVSLPFSLAGFWGVYGSVDGRTGLQIYDGELLEDLQSGGGFRWRWPFDFGEHLWANHALQVSGDFLQIDVAEPDRFDADSLLRAGLPVPQRHYKEHRLGLSWSYAKRRPQESKNDHAQSGQGATVKLTWADDALGSDTVFRRLTVDASKALRLPVGGSGLFARGRLRSTWGDPAPQDFTGLRGDVPLLPMTYLRDTNLDRVLDADEGFFVRGSTRNVTGDKAAVATLEWRLPLLPALPVSAFGFSLGGLTAVGFYDYGRVWDGGTAIFTRHTVGWELRAALRLGGTSLVVPSYGQGQTLDWDRGNDPFEKDVYYKLAMVQPF